MGSVVRAWDVRDVRDQVAAADRAVAPQSFIEFFCQTTSSMQHPHKIKDQDHRCQVGGGVYLALVVGSDISHTTPQATPVCRGRVAYIAFRSQLNFLRGLHAKICKTQKEFVRPFRESKLGVCLVVV